jgi:PAS domain S-box-containing protein
MGTSIRVLHVDDEPSFSDLVSDFLEREDDRFEVVTEASAADGLERIKDDPPDCVVSDYDMPGMNGIEFLEEVRSVYSNLPFILFTGKGSEEVASDALSAGATDYLQKGGGTDQYALLANRVRNAVEQYRSTRERDRVYQALETATQGIGLIADNGEYIYLNEAYADLYGYDTADLIGDHWSQLYPEDEVTRFEEEILPTLEEEGSWDGRSQGLCHDGSLVPEQVSLTQLDSGGHVCVVQDISNRIERQQELELRNRAINEAPVGVTITDPSQEDNPIIYANEEFIDTSGYSREEIIGENHRILQGPETREAPVEKMREAIDAREPVTAELRNYRKNGEIFWNRVSVAPVHDQDGNVTNYIGFQENITKRKEREQELRRNERRFKAMFNDPNILVGLLETDGTVVDINETAMEYIESGIEDVREQPFWETPWWEHNSELQESVKEWIEKAANGEYVPFETDITQSDGELATVNGVFRPVQDRDGEIVSLIISDRDITDRKDRERRFEAMFEDPNILVGLLEPDGTVLNINDTAMEYIDSDLEDITGTPFSTTPWWPEEMQSVIQETVKQAANGEYVEYEANLEKPDGTPYSVTGVIRPVTNDRDVVISLIVSARDVTERVKREKTLDAILENTTTPLFLKNRDGEYLLVNNGFRELFGLEDSDVRGETDAELFPPAMAEEVQKNDDYVLETGEPVETEEHVVTEDSEYVFLSSKVPVYDIGIEPDSDEPVAVFGVANDITERKQREQILERQNKRFDELANTVSHDLQTPLSTARGRAEMAIETGDTEQMEKALTALERADRLREDLVNVLRTKEIVGETESVDLDTVAEEVWESITASDKASLRIEDSATVDADPDAVRRLFENLFSNSVEHSGEDVTIRLGQIDDGFYVEDDGPGISPGERDEVFTAGYSTKEGGSGVGMVSVREIILSHKWTISITESESGGARFEITDVKKSD